MIYRDKELASFDELLAFCNKVREIGGKNPLDSLIPAIPQEPNECLIALNLNFSCSVNILRPKVRGESYSHLGYENGEMVWGMFTSSELAKEVTEQLENVGIWLNEKSEPVIVLPAKIGRIAGAFDEWADDPDSYPEFEPYVEESAKERILEMFAPKDY